MKISTFGFFIKEVGLSLWRNRWLCLATIGTIFTSMVVLGVCMLLILNANNLIEKVESDLEIVVYLKDLPEDQVKVVGERLRGLDGITSVEFVHKKDALASLERRYQGGQNLEETLGGENPLPDAYHLKAGEPHEVPVLAEKVAVFTEVDEVRYGQEFVEQLLSLTKWLRLLGAAVGLLLGLAAVFLIATTIRLTVFARRQEITIMKFVGATDWFIRWPFILEGMSLGFLGSVLAGLVLYFGYDTFRSSIEKVLSFLPLVNEPLLLWQLLGSLLAAGIILGAVGSMISIRKFLKV